MLLATPPMATAAPVAGHARCPGTVALVVVPALPQVVGAAVEGCSGTAAAAGEQVPALEHGGGIALAVVVVTDQILMQVATTGAGAAGLAVRQAAPAVATLRQCDQAPSRVATRRDGFKAVQHKLGV